VTTKRRLVVELGVRSTEALERAQRRDGSTATAVVNRAVRVFDTLTSLPEGSKVQIVRPDGSVQGLVIL
jgi:hypothetical protein